MKRLSSAFVALSLSAICLCGISCVKVNTSLGQDFNPIEQMYDVYSAEVDLTDIKMAKIDSLSAYSSRRVTIGSLRDETFGLTSRSSAFTLIPISDTLDFGSNTEFRQFHLGLAPEESSYDTDSEDAILQTFHVYSLKDAGIILDSSLLYANSIKKEMFAKYKEVTQSPIVYASGDSLSFNLSKEFGKQLLDDMIKSSKGGVMVLDTITTFTKIFPGLFICCDDPYGIGGRINLFNHKISYTSTISNITGNYSVLKFRADYGSRKNVDTSFVFIVGAPDIPGKASNITEQFAFNICEHEFKTPEGQAGENIFVEGGIGLKPVIKASEIRKILLDDIQSRGIKDPEKVILNKVTLHIPYECPADYDELNKYPSRLSPVCRISSTDKDKKKYVSYANLADASLTNEDQGKINRSLDEYSPDISFHAQKILNLKDPDEKTLKNYDIWFLITSTETTISSTTDSEYQDMYNQLAMMQYYNSLYGYGYGGYGGYGYGGFGGYGGYGGYGYNSYYSNYYTMAALYNSMYSSNGSTTSEELDKDRFYRAVLNGPGSKNGRVPRMTITYSVSKTL